MILVKRLRLSHFKLIGPPTPRDTEASNADAVMHDALGPVGMCSLIGINSTACHGSSTVRSLQRVEHGADLTIGRSLPVISFHCGPHDASSGIDHIDSRVRNTIALLAVIGRIVQAVGINNLMLRIGKEQEIDCPFAVCSNLRGKLFARSWTVHTDGIEAHGFMRVHKEPQVGYLPTAIGSPRAAIEHQDNRRLPTGL